MEPVVVSHLARLSLVQDTECAGAFTVLRTAQMVRTWRDNTIVRSRP